MLKHFKNILVRSIIILTVIGLFASSFMFSQPKVDANELADKLDEKFSYDGDFSATLTMIQQEINDNTGKKETTTKIAELYRKDEDDKFLMIFTSPKTDAGSGYLYIDKNLWFYDSESREFTRKTVSESIGGTDSKQRDLEESKLTDYYNFKYEKEEKVGKIDCHVIIGESKGTEDLEYPVTRMWISKDDTLIIKREEYTVDAVGKNLDEKRPSQTIYYLKYNTITDERTSDDVYFIQKMLIINNKEKGRKTILEFSNAKLEELPRNIFSKAYLENRSN